MGRESKTLYSLQAGRALAALAIVLHHAALAGRDFGGMFAGFKIFERGYLGVDFFFVLSGFIIYHSTAGRQKAPLDYAIARARRIYAPYLPVGVGIAILYFMFPGVSQGDRAWGWTATLTLLPVGKTALSVAWTLQHEIVFYALFGLLYFNNRLGSGLLVWGLLIVVVSYVTRAHSIVFDVINLEFIIGVCAAVVASEGRSHWLAWPAALGCLLLWGALGAVQEFSVIIGLGIGLIVPAIVAAERSGRFVVPVALKFLGAASYSIYLVHGFAISFVARMLHDSWPIVWVSSLCGVAAGALYYLSVERPSLQFGKYWRSGALQVRTPEG